MPRDQPATARRTVHHRQLESSARFECSSGISSSGPCIEGTICPTEAPSLRACKSFCASTRSCTAILYNRYGHCYLKQRLGPTFADDGGHHTRACSLKAPFLIALLQHGCLNGSLPSALHGIKRTAKVAVPTSTSMLRDNLFGGRDVFEGVDVATRHVNGIQVRKPWLNDPWTLTVRTIQQVLDHLEQSSTSVHQRCAASSSTVCPLDDVLAYAEMVGMDSKEDIDLLWIADEALQA